MYIGDYDHIPVAHIPVELAGKIACLRLIYPTNKLVIARY